MNSEKASKAVKIFDSTYDLILKNKERKSAPVFIEEAVNFYVRSIKDGDPFTTIMKAIDRIESKESTSLGLLCEVLRQAGILNGNGEVSFSRKE